MNKNHFLAQALFMEKYKMSKEERIDVLRCLQHMLQEPDHQKWTAIVDRCLAVEKETNET